VPHQGMKVSVDRAYKMYQLYQLSRTLSISTESPSDLVLTCVSWMACTYSQVPEHHKFHDLLHRGNCLDVNTCCLAIWHIMYVPS